MKLEGGFRLRRCMTSRSAKLVKRLGTRSVRTGIDNSYRASRIRIAALTQKNPCLGSDSTRVTASSNEGVAIHLPTLSESASLVVDHQFARRGYPKRLATLLLLFEGLFRPG